MKQIRVGRRSPYEVPEAEVLELEAAFCVMYGNDDAEEKEWGEF
jgi:hypothetical protein